jgi:hypothetical protein
MTKRDETVFAKAFEKMEAKGYFVELRAKNKAKTNAKVKPAALKTAQKTRRRAAADSVSSRAASVKVPLAAHKG